MQAGLVNLMHEMTVAAGQSPQLPPASSSLAGSDPARPPPHSTDQRDRALVENPDSETKANSSSAATDSTSGISDVPRRSMLGRLGAHTMAAQKGAVDGNGRAAASEDSSAS